MRLRLRRIHKTSKLDRRREESWGRISRDRVMDALTGRPDTWPAGKHGERRMWSGSPWIFLDVREVGPVGPPQGKVMFSGWFRDVP